MGDRREGLWGGEGGEERSLPPGQRSMQHHRLAPAPGPPTSSSYLLTFYLLRPPPPPPFPSHRLQELLDKCSPLGMFDSIATLAVAANMQDLYRLVLVDTPLAPYFSRALAWVAGWLIGLHCMAAK